VGALHWHKIDLRIIAATHRDLKAEAGTGRFRQDLYYGLNVMTIRLPPWRERREDIPPLLGHFIDLGRAEGLKEFCAGDDGDWRHDELRLAGQRARVEVLRGPQGSASFGKRATDRRYADGSREITQATVACLTWLMFRSKTRSGNSYVHARPR
jgi:hypothetical protein